MWPIVFRALRVYAPYVTLPFAAIVGFIGYKIENRIRDNYTPYSAPIKESRNERLISDETLQKATNVESLQYSADVLGKNVSPSLK